MLKNGLLFLLLGLLFTACEVHSEYSFNKDYSGRFEFTFDMSELMSLGAMADQEDSQEEIGFKVDEETIKEYESKLNALEGISKADVLVEEGLINYQFSFEKPEDIQKSGRVLTELIATLVPEDSLQMDSDLPFGSDELLPQRFEYKKKSFYFQLMTADADLGSEADMEDMPLDFFKLQFTFSFKRKIKDVDLSGFEIAFQTDNNIKLELPLNSLQSEPWVRLKLK
jgi:hypothetical protein